MRALDEARSRVDPPTPKHEAYQVNPWNRVDGSILSKPCGHTFGPAACAICKNGLGIGWEIAYRLQGTHYKDRRFLYVHKVCLKPTKMYFSERSVHE